VNLPPDKAIERTAEIIESYAQASRLDYDKAAAIELMHLIGLNARDSIVLSLFDEWSDYDSNWRSKKQAVDSKNARRWKD